MSNTFKVMTGPFGTDGLISKHAVFKGASVEACGDWLLEQIAAAPNRMALDELILHWIEEHTDPDDDYSAVRVDEPYPQDKRHDDPRVWPAISARSDHFRSLGDLGRKWVTHEAA